MERVRKRAHKTLACVIQCHVRPGNETRYGAEIDHSATSARQHSRQEAKGHVGQGAYIDIDNPHLIFDGE